MRKALAVGACIALLTLGLLVGIGPRPIVTASEATGDPTINLDSLTEHGKVTSFVMTPESTKFAGRGADENTDVEIGSVTKTMTAEIARRQIERGELSWPTKLGEILDLGDSDAANITIAELVNHRSGLPRNPFLNIKGMARMFVFNGNPDEEVTEEAMLKAARNASTENKGHEEYSNFGYGLLSLALAKNAGISQEEMFQKEIFEPAGMTDSYLMVPGSVPEDATRGLAADGRTAAPWDSEGMAGAGAVRSTAKDMAAYTTYVLKHADFSRGWQYSGEDHAFWHNGATGGFFSMLLIDPDTRTAAWINSATNNSPEDAAAQLLKEARG